MKHSFLSCISWKQLTSVVLEFVWWRLTWLTPSAERMDGSRTCTDGACLSISFCKLVDKWWFPRCFVANSIVIHILLFSVLWKVQKIFGNAPESTTTLCFYSLRSFFYQHLAVNERYGPSLLNFPSSPDPRSWVLCCHGDSHMGSVVAVCFAGANAVLFGRSQAARWEPAWRAGWGVRHWGWPHPVCAGTQPALSSSQAGPQQARSDRKI